MPQKIKFKKQYKPIGFGDGPDPGTVEGHRNAMIEAAETRAYNRRMKELEVEDKYKRESLLEKIFGFFFSGRGDTDFSQGAVQFGSPLMTRWHRQMQKTGSPSYPSRVLSIPRSIRDRPQHKDLPCRPSDPHRVGTCALSIRRLCSCSHLGCLRKHRSKLTKSWQNPARKPLPLSHLHCPR